MGCSCKNKKINQTNTQPVTITLNNVNKPIVTQVPLPN